MAVSVGTNHACALRTDGTLACWGNNSLFQLIAPTGTFTALSAGSFHTCALRTDGTLACWGNNLFSQFLNIPVGTFTALNAKGADNCALRTDGTLACWGRNFFGQLTGIPTGTFTAVSVGYAHNCALRTDGTLACWGYNGEGQLDNIPADTFTALSAGGTHTCALRSNGTLACWGDNRLGQLNNIPIGNFARRIAPVISGAGHTFSGFRVTVANPPKLNRVKAGRRVPLIWFVTDANGQPVTTLTSATISVEPLACPAGKGQPVKKAKKLPAHPGFQNLGKGKYLYNWKTRRAFANTCKTVKLSFSSGQADQGQALFRFTRK